ncbi:MAG TPA: ABC transporter ATP-binding protein [Acetobacteraceae bacterium]|jgi:subfamily B ATP-binding cassette protein MsbA|nr:ABC transporter ATP-binding protein [Acetobacteraceae bacterium]
MDATTPRIELKSNRDSTRVLLGRLWREHVRHHKSRLLLVLVLTGLMAGTTALYPVVIDHAFQMFSDRDRRILYQVPALVLAITSIKAAAQYFQNVQVQQIVLLVIRELQGRMFAHLARADLARLEREAPAQLAARFTTDATIVRDALTRAVNGIADAVTVIGLIGSMLYLDWLLSVIAAAMYPLAAVPIQRIGKRIRRASGGMQERMGETAAMLNESFTQARTVRAYRLEASETHRAEDAFTQLYRALMRMTKGRARVDPVLEVLGGAAVAAVIGFAGWRAAISSQTIGNFTGFVAALLIASRPLRALGSLNAALQEGLAGLTRVFTVVDERPSIEDAADAVALPPGHGHVAFDNVHFVYPDGRTALSGLSFEASPGSTIALVGPSGAGKSTALALIPRLQDATAGAVRIDGADVRHVTLATLRDAIAYVAQDTLLFDDTVAANILMGRPGASQAEIAAAAEAAAAAVFIAALPDGFATRVGPGGQRLSGGQRQRIALARALLRDPRILLLDEATSSLDTESEAAIQLALGRLRQGRTTIVIAHRLSTVRDADLVVVMQDGRAVERGNHAALLDQDGLYARLVRSQALAQ